MILQHCSQLRRDVPDVCLDVSHSTTSVTNLGNTLTGFGILSRDYLVFWQNFEPTLAKKFAIDQLYIVVNLQILNV